MEITKKIFSFYLVIHSIAVVSSTVTHIEYDGLHSMDTSRTNYAISEPLGGAGTLGNWRTVSVNGDELEAYGADCSVTTMPISQMSPEESRLLRNAIVRIHGDVGHFNLGSEPTNIAKKQISDNSIALKPRASDKYSVYRLTHYTIVKLDENNYSVSSRGFYHNMTDIFVTSDVVTFVYMDGMVRAQPAFCLDDELQRILGPIEGLVNLAEPIGPVWAAYEQRLKQTEISLKATFLEMLQKFKAKVDSKRATLRSKLSILMTQQN